MKTRVLATLMAVASSFGLLVATGGAATAEPVTTKDVANGMAIDIISPNNTDRYNCTLGPVGLDSAGRKVGITAGHCNLDANDNPIAPQGVEVPNGTYAVYDADDRGFGPIGYTRFVSAEQTYHDYMVIEFVPNATPKSQGPNLRVDSIYPGIPGSLFNSICKDGRTTNMTCGRIMAIDGGLLATQAGHNPGDSGGAAVLSPSTGTKWVGIVTRTSFIPFAAYVYTSSANILNDLNPRGVVGSGFVPVNNY